MTMRKWFFYPRWNFERAEAYLEAMEADGWILDEISFSYCFRFKRKKSPPRAVKYLYTYTDKGDVGMNPIEDHLKGVYFAKGTACGKRTGAKFYRVVDLREDIAPIRKAQRDYLKKIYLIRLIVALCFLLPCIFAWVTHGTGAVTGAILNAAGVGLGIYILHCGIGLLYLLKRKSG